MVVKGAPPRSGGFIQTLLVDPDIALRFQVAHLRS
jgi:hypothetical protein